MNNVTLAARIRRLLRIRYCWVQLKNFILLTGVWGAFKHVFLDQLLYNKSEYNIEIRGIVHPLIGRYGSSDILVLGQVFLDREYQALRENRSVDLVIDCGANVGYSAAYFLSEFPQSIVIAVEPDPDNFLILKRNLAPYGERARVLQKGIWSKPVRLKIAESKYRDGRAWSKQVVECDVADPEGLDGIDIGSLLAEFGREHLSILKIDIEGAEAEVFASECSWLEKVDTLAIELHEDSMFGNGRAVFTKAIANTAFELTTVGDLTICRRTRTVLPL